MSDVGLGLAQVAPHPDINSTKITWKAGNLQKVAKSGRDGEECRARGKEGDMKGGRAHGREEEIPALTAASSNPGWNVYQHQERPLT